MVKLQARWTPEDLAVQSAAMQGQQRAAAPQTAAARGHGLAAADPADDPNLSPEQQSSPYLRHWFEDQRVHARKLAQQLAASEAAGSAPAASWASEVVLSPASLQAEDAGLLNGLTDATWFASFDQAAAQQRQVKQLAAAQAAEAAAADSAAVAAQQPAPAAGPAAEQAGVGDAAAVQVPPHVLAAVQGRLLLETFGSKQGAQQGGMMLISNVSPAHWTMSASLKKERPLYRLGLCSSLWPMRKPCIMCSMKHYMHHLFATACHMAIRQPAGAGTGGEAAVGLCVRGHCRLPPYQRAHWLNSARASAAAGGGGGAAAGTRQA